MISVYEKDYLDWRPAFLLDQLKGFDKQTEPAERIAYDSLAFIFGHRS